ncbi:glycosyltransferase family 4 protein [Bacteroidales bacterium OttesenSCG-928-K03]|nr:glycosyltransferase family 4 protein [Odoribacter sp. OttesenSCG-928-L07]MDL2239585.1 glycosyltransferase family 4 protein [Bacteroidales bacterium OttesenSCG-928-L14]MDL2242545.1 glycosyltransferase family 4 protein [Bacteroidales bacterium OttesenSCG-928-K03]
MKALMFGWEFPPHITGGLGTASFGMVKGLRHHNADVIFVVPKAYGDEDSSLANFVNASEIEIDIYQKKYIDLIKQMTYIEVESTLIPYLGPVEFERYVEKLQRSTDIMENPIYRTKYEFRGSYGANLMDEVARYALVASQIAVEHDFDIIHAHDWLTYSAGVAAKNASGKPLVVHVHATEFDRTGENVNTIVYQLEKAGMEAADKVIAVSNLTAETVIKKYGIDPAKVVTVHNAVEPSDTQGLENVKKNVKEKVVTFLGRLTFQKGPEYFVEAAKLILERDKNVRFVMAGSGDLFEKMVKYVARLGISTHFHFTGFLKGEEVDKMFALSDVFVMPSVSEPFGIVPLEAMRLNVPVVISKQSGVSEVLEYAIKVDFWDVNAMADAIYGLLHYDALYDVCQRYGKEEILNLKWEKAAKKILDVYTSVLNS